VTAHQVQAGLDANEPAGCDAVADGAAGIPASSSRRRLTIPSWAAASRL
jgi:hypothetical protein